MITGTFFFHEAAKHKKEFALSIDKLVELIETFHAPSKTSLRWIKLARFGDLTTAKGSLRHNRNVLAVSGVEADYDQEQIAFDEAVEKLEQAGVEAIAYTSPSHREDKPRWRVLAPLSKEYPPAERERFLARLNGLFGGVLGGESFTLSQSYYFGYVGNGTGQAPASHRAKYVQGNFIDLRNDLDAGAIGKTGKLRKDGEEQQHGPRLDFKAAVTEIVSGGDFHVPMRRIMASMAARGTNDLIISDIAHALHRVALTQRPDLAGREKDIPKIMSWVREQEDKKQQQKTIATTAAAAQTKATDGAPAQIAREDFFAIMPQNVYVYIPTLEFWPAAVIDKRIAKKTSTWICKNRGVEQVTWAPGEPQIITNKIVTKGGFIDGPGNRIFNLYLPPKINGGDPSQAQPWINHVQLIYPDDAEHIIRWCAYCVQNQNKKINHALVLGGNMGVGKDTMIEPLRHAVGHWNFHEVSPQRMLGVFNGYLKSTVLRINEARDLGESDRFKFYDHMKTLLAVPPFTSEINEKNLKEYLIPNLINIIITTNYKADGIFLPADDRRHYVAWSQLSRNDFPPDYWNKIWGWYDNGGLDHTAAYLRTISLSDFDPKAPPPQTRAFWDIADASRAPEDAELADVIDRLGQPDTLTLGELVTVAIGGILEWLNDRKNRRAIPHRLEKAGYVPIRSATKDGLWIINGERKTIYAKSTLSIREQIAAAQHRQ